MTVTLTWFNPGKKVYWRGKWWDAALVEVNKSVEKELGYAQYYYQGSYNVGVAASGNTHNKGGVMDKVSKGLTCRKAYAKRGVICCPRTPAQGFMVHDHCVMMGAKTGSPALKSQMYSLKAGRNGLVNNRADDSGVRDVFVSYPKWKKGRSTPAAKKKIPPLCYLDGVNNSRKFGAKVRPYNSVRLIQTALNKYQGGEDLKVDGVIGPVTLQHFNTFRKNHFGADHASGSIGAASVKLLFKKAGMKVQVWDKLKAKGGKLQ